VGFHERKRLLVGQEYHLVLAPIDLSEAIRFVGRRDHALAPERDVVPGLEISPLFKARFVPSGNLPERAFYSGKAELVPEVWNPLDHLAYDGSTFHERFPQFRCWSRQAGLVQTRRWQKRHDFDGPTTQRHVEHLVFFHLRFFTVRFMIFSSPIHSLDLGRRGR